jgi:hypothetical protein
MYYLKSLINNSNHLQFSFEKENETYLVTISTQNEDFDISEEISEIILHLFPNLLTDKYGEVITTLNEDMYFFIDGTKEEFVLNEINVFDTGFSISEMKFNNELQFYIALFKRIGSELCISREEIKEMGKKVKTPLDLLKEYFSELNLNLEEYDSDEYETEEGTEVVEFFPKGVEDELEIEEKTIKLPSFGNTISYHLSLGKSFESCEEKYFDSGWYKCLIGIKNKTRPEVWYK